MMTEAGKTFTAWAWKHLEDGFLKFLGRKIEDAKEGSEWLQSVEARFMDFDWGKAAERYKDRMVKNYGYIRVLGSTEPIDFDEIFTDVQILDKPLAFQRFDVTRLHELQQEPERLWRVERRRGLDVVTDEKGHRLYILGKPGAGKTTFLKYLVHQTVKEQLGRIPIFVTLKDWADKGGALLPFIAEQFDICHFPDAAPFIEYLLESGHAVLLFDGLDEVNLEEGIRDRMIGDLRDFCIKHHAAQAIITCRVAASDYSFVDFTYVEMADFDDGQITAYARNWFYKSGKTEPFLKEFQKPENKGIRDLGRSPLLLSLICLAYDTTLHIPERRVELYEEALDALLKKWDAARNIRRDEIYKHLSLGRKRQLFAHLAFKAFEKGEIFFPRRQLVTEIEAFLKKLPAADLKDEPDGEAVLKAIAAQHGILTERAYDLYTFSHLTFQEYYAAKYIVENSRLGTFQHLMTYLMDDRWREVFILTASLLDEGDDFFEVMFKTITYLIEQDEELLKIQNWVERKASKVNGFHPSGPICAYWFFALDFKTKHIAPLINSLLLSIDLNFTRALYRAINLAIEPAYKFSNLPFTRTYNLGHTLNLYLSLNSAFIGIFDYPIKDLTPLARENAEIIYLDALLHYAKVYLDNFSLGWRFQATRNLYSKLHDFFQEISRVSRSVDIDFNTMLKIIPFPTEKSATEDWIHFAKNFHTMTLEQREIGYEWEINNTQIERIEQYLKATKLLLDCLDVATVTNREKILEKVLTKS